MAARYVPILRDKRAELHALADLPPEKAVNVLPLIDVRQPEAPGRSRRPWSPDRVLHERVTNPYDGLVGCWHHDAPVLVDLGGLDPYQFDTDRHPAEQFLDWTEAVGISAVPVTGRDRSPDYRHVVSLAARRLERGACIRLRGADLGAGESGLSIVLRELDLPRTQIDLVLDLADIPVDNWFVLSDVAGQYLRSFQPLTRWRSVTLAGTSFPAQLFTLVDYNSHEVVDRVEFELWDRVKRILSPSPEITFGDYGIVNAATQPAFRGAANIRYTLEDRWLLLRGYHPDKAPPDDYARLGRDLVELDGWFGEDHCPGCAFIAEHAAHGPSGNATQWRQAAFSHHFAVVGSQLQ